MSDFNGTNGAEQAVVDGLSYLIHSSLRALRIEYYGSGADQDAVEDRMREKRERVRTFRRLRDEFELAAADLTEEALR